MKTMVSKFDEKAACN